MWIWVVITQIFISITLSIGVLVQDWNKISKYIIDREEKLKLKL